VPTYGLKTARKAFIWPSQKEETKPMVGTIERQRFPLLRCKMTAYRTNARVDDFVPLVCGRQFGNASRRHLKISLRGMIINFVRTELHWQFHYVPIYVLILIWRVPPKLFSIYIYIALGC
jgi:hypothetical protein